MDKIKQRLANGYHIKWVGYHSERHVIAHLNRLSETVKLIIKLDKDYTEDSFRRILSSSAAQPGSISGTIWSSDSRLELLRLASILGINVGGSCQPGCGQEFNGTIGCLMAYDIESDRSRLPLSSFGSMSESITSIAIYCSCGETRVFSFIPDVDFDYIQCKDSKDTVSEFMRYVKSHCPQWLAGYNNFGYDNTRIAYHSDDEFDSILIPMRVGSGSSLTYAFYIDIEGTYNIDLMAYLDKTRRSSYMNMSLATVVKHHGIEDKMEFDTADVQDFAKLFEYNLHDCKITMELALKSGALTEIVSLCTAACVPVIDSVRFVSGTFAACSVASYCLQNKICMDWSPPAFTQEYRGAEVLKPIIGVHQNVVSCDFSSMYPTVLLGANISIENCTVVKSNSKEGSTWKSLSSTNFVINEKKVSFSNLSNVIIPPVMRLFVERRKQVRKSNPAYALGLKIAANSIYGSLGDRNSRIYSPNCSAAVTTGGRWCLALAESILKKYGYRVVYGDTDSCFVAPTNKVKCELKDVMLILSRIFSYTPFPGMSMEIENKYSKIAFLGKKTYFGMMDNGQMISKGMSKSRKDRIGVCRSLTSHVIQLVLSPVDRRLQQTCIGDMISIIVDLAVSRSLKLSAVSKIIKRGGSNYFEYKTLDGKRDTLECETNTGDETVAYAPAEICALLVKEMKCILSVTSIGSFADVIRQSSQI